MSRANAGITTCRDGPCDVVAPPIRRRAELGCRRQARRHARRSASARRDVESCRGAQGPLAVLTVRAGRSRDQRPAHERRRPRLPEGWRHRWFGSSSTCASLPDSITLRLFNLAQQRPATLDGADHAMSREKQLSNHATPPSPPCCSNRTNARNAVAPANRSGMRLDVSTRGSSRTVVR